MRVLIIGAGLSGLAGRTARHGARFRTGLRPVTPDGSPSAGETWVKGVFVNAGHGPPGWTLACGSGKLIADLILGMPPGIAPPLSRSRAFREDKT